MLYMLMGPLCHDASAADMDSTWDFLPNEMESGHHLSWLFLGVEEGGHAKSGRRDYKWQVPWVR